MEHYLKTDLQTRKDRYAEEIRLNKYLSDSGICSRREADRLIEDGRVTIDGVAAVLGQKVRSGQLVCVDGKAVSVDERLILLAFHKPVGIECTTSREVPDNIIDYINYPSRIFPVGRLDKNSSGLILLTNTGDISDQILRGSHYHEKEYEVTVDRDISREFLRKMQNGVEIGLEDDTKKVVTRPCKATAVSKRTFRIVLTQGLNRQIRRMCDALGYHVVSLKRIRVMNILLGSLKEGQYRMVSSEELKELLEQLHMNINCN